MKKNFLRCSLRWSLSMCVLLLSTFHAAEAQDPNAPVGIPGSWTKTFDSNFNQPNALNAFNLTVDRLGNHTYSGNGENEYYEASQVSIINDPTYGSLLNLEVSPNLIYINNHGSPYYSSGNDYPSGAVCTKYFAQVGGVFEIRCKAPTGGETWPAFWLLPGTIGNQTTNQPGQAISPYQNEIDIFEMLGSGQSNTLDKTPANNWFHVDWHLNVTPYVGDGAWINVSKYLPSGQNLVNSFHTYSACLVPNVATYIYFDGNLVFSETNPKLTQSVPFYILTNLAYGGTWGGHGLPIAANSGAVSGSDFQVQYIRAFAKAAVATPQPTPPAPPSPPTYSNGHNHKTSGHNTSAHGATGHSSSAHGATGHSSSAHGTTGHSSSTHGTTGHSSSAHGATGHSSSAHGATGHSSSAHGTTGHSSSTHGTTGHSSSAHGATGHSPSGHGAGGHKGF